MYQIVSARAQQALAAAMWPGPSMGDHRAGSRHFNDGFGQHPPAADGRYNGQFSQWLTRMLDEIDYGMLLVSADAQVLYVNDAARHEMDAAHPLQLMGHALRAHHPQDMGPLIDALNASQRGLRRLLTLGDGEHRVSVSVVPLPCTEGESASAAGQTTLLVLGKRQLCAQRAVQGFARSMALTPTETRVLELLCRGVRPTEIATRQGVAVSTVRTQIGSIRGKTGAGSIRELVRQVALLPPLVGALRAGDSQRANGSFAGDSQRANGSFAGDSQRAN
jgi:DNA-binding CsgD family transcriptional regulator